MSHELFWLVMTAAMTGLMWVPYILDRIMVRGVAGAMANPSPTDKPQSPWAQRLMAAHINAVENLIVFAAARFGGARPQRQRFDADDGDRLRALFLVAARARRGVHARHPGAAHARIRRRVRRAGHGGAGAL